MEQNNQLQVEMETCITDFIAWLNQPTPGGVCCMLAPEFVSCNYAERTLTVRFPIREWMRNPGGVVHGGAVASAMDTAMGSQTFFWAGDQMTPTINMLCNFMRPVPLDSTLYVRSRITYVGRKMLYVSAEAWTTDETEPLVSAQGVYHIPSKKPARVYIPAAATEPGSEA